jgi:hypothetical protein
MTLLLCGGKEVGMRLRGLFLVALLILTACGGGGSGSDPAVSPPGAPISPSYDAVSAAAKLDDEAPLLEGSAAAPQAGPLRMLVLLPTEGFVYPDLRKIQIHLDGFGLRPEYVAAADLGDRPLAEYSALLVVNSAWQPVALDQAALASIAAAVEAGLDLLWLGGVPPPELESVLGVAVVGRPNRSTIEDGLASVRYTGPAGGVSIPLWDDSFTEVELTGASAQATFEPGGSAALTVYRAGPGAGRAILIPFTIQFFWGQEEAQPFTWSRAELLSDTLSLLLSRGAALLSPFPDGYPSALFLRLEDISPGGSRFSRFSPDWLDRFERMRDELATWKVPMQLGLIARYVDPATDEDFGWEEPGAGRQRLRTLLQETLDAGSELIGHGWTHQYGDGLTGDGFEFSFDLAGGQRVFLPLDEQRARIAAARDELQRAFGIAPAVWETPHLAGNGDTYRAAAEVGFTYVNENDDHLFPNRWGFADHFGGHLLNLPQAGSFVPLNNPQAYLEVTLEAVLPRLVRLRAPFLFFYHGFTDDQFTVMRTLVDAGVQCGLWTPTLSEFGTWWQQRDGISLATEQLESGIIRTIVSDPVPGTTLRVRLPDGKLPVSVFANDAELAFYLERHRGVAFARVVIPAGSNPTRIDVRHD